MTKITKPILTKQQRKALKRAKTTTDHPQQEQAEMDLVDTIVSDIESDSNESLNQHQISNSATTTDLIPHPIESHTEDDPRTIIELMREITSTGRHFCTIAPKVFVFADDVKSYVNWTVQFHAEMDYYELAETLQLDPNSNPNEPTKLNKHKQKTVYNMIIHCVPNAQIRQVVTTSLLPSLHTGYGAWRALREHYLGDELAYLQATEAKFNNFRWEPSESWSTFETRFESLVTELVAVGVEKMDHQRKGRLMAAIQESNRKDAQNSSVFERLHTTNRIKENLPYRQWLIAIRTEAQMIQDELTKRGTNGKRVREDGEGGYDSQQVSFVANNGSLNTGQRSFKQNWGGPGQQTRPNGQNGRHGHTPPGAPCWNMQRTGQCSFGNNCRFNHNVARGSSSGSPPHGGFNGGKGRGEACRKFAASGHCFRGNNCPYPHIPNGGAANGPNSTGHNTGQSVDTKHQAFTVNAQL